MIVGSFGRYMAETDHDHEVNLARERRAPLLAGALDAPALLTHSRDWRYPLSRRGYGVDAAFMSFQLRERGFHA